MLFRSNRRLQNDIPPISTFIDSDDNYIVFYGTSLSLFDNDYYSNILNFFNKKKTIFFCYSDYDGKNLKSDFTSSVQQMINRIYPNSFYRLIEQGRMKIVKV